MKQWTVRLGLSLMVLVGFWTNRLPAQGQGVYVLPQPGVYPQAVYPQGVFVVPAAPYEPAHHYQTPPGFAPHVPPPPAGTPFLRCMNKHGLGCAVDPFYSPCGNLHYELRFIFGSCRTYYGEACSPWGPGHGRSGSGGNGSCVNGSCGNPYRSW